MSWINRHIIAPLSPSWALARERAAQAFKAHYEAADAGRLRKPRVIRSSANSELQRDGVKLRGLARYQEANFDIAKGALDVLVANIVGAGIQPEPQVKLKDGKPASELNSELLALFKDWAENPEVTWEMDYYTLQRMVCRSWLRDGEVLTQILAGPVDYLDHGTVVPYSLEAIEADYLPFDYTSEKPRIVQGVELNTWNRPLAYHVYKQHPGDSSAVSGQTKRVPAGRMIHLKHMLRLHQVRGVSLFASVLNRFDDIKEIDESERVAARVAAAMAGFIKKGTPDIYTAPEVGADGKPVYRNMELSPGMIFDDLAPGEDVGTITSNRPNNALIPFRDSQLRSAAAGLGPSFSSLARNYNGTYSAQRQELVEGRRHFETLSGYFVRRFAHVVWQGFVQAAIASGKVKPGTDVDMSTYFDATHTPPAMVWINPVHEADANKTMQEQGYKSRSEIIRERGRSPDEVNQEILRDQEESERLGLELGAPKPAAPEPQPEPDPPEDEGPDETAEALAAMAAQVALAEARVDEIARAVAAPREATVEPIAGGGFRVVQGGRP